MQVSCAAGAARNSLLAWAFHPIRHVSVCHPPRGTCSGRSITSNSRLSTGLHLVGHRQSHGRVVALHARIPVGELPRGRGDRAIRQKVCHHVRVHACRRALATESDGGSAQLMVVACSGIVKYGASNPRTIVSVAGGLDRGAGGRATTYTGSRRSASNRALIVAALLFLRPLMTTVALSAVTYEYA